MPATKYEFTPADGEFKGARTFAMLVRHLSVTNHILAAAALGEPASTDIDEPFFVILRLTIGSKLKLLPTRQS